MRRRHALPRLILVTDARLGDALWPALVRLPRGAGVLFRDDHLPTGARRARFEQVRRIARRRRLVLLLAGSPGQAVAWQADGCHGPLAFRRTPRRLMRSMAVHDGAEFARARRAGVDLLLVSPVFATRSHPGAPALGRVKLGLLLGTRGRDAVVALGGMTPARALGLRLLGVRRWAAIDGLTPQPQPHVPGPQAGSPFAEDTEAVVPYSG